MTTGPRIALASGLTLSYASDGPADGVPVVLVPGPTDSWRSYEPVMDQLSGSIRTVAISCRGHGDSDKPASGYGIDDFALDTLQVLDALGFERVVLAGHSGSCMTVRQVALRRPERVAGLLLEASPTTLRGDTALESFVASVINGLEDPIGRDFATTWIADTSTANLADSDIARLVDDVLKVPARVWHEMFGNLVQWDDTAELPNLSMATRLVWGDDDQIVTRTAQDKLLAAIPRASLSVYEGVGHTPRWEQPARFARELASFVAECTASER